MENNNIVDNMKNKLYLELLAFKSDININDLIINFCYNIRIKDRLLMDSLAIALVV